MTDQLSVFNNRSRDLTGLPSSRLQQHRGGDGVPDNKHRWHSLRQKFLRLRKAYVKSGSGSDAAKKQWALFDNLMFLNDAIQSRRQAI
ncbi:hypothetical protein MRX96_046306 [Rhipicephalus microplus]